MTTSNGFNSFEEYIDYVRANLANLIEYRAKTGSLSASLLKIKSDLSDRDPFVVLEASLYATALLADKKLYH